MSDKTPQEVIASTTHTLRPFQEVPEVGEWLVCPSGHVLGQYVENERTGFKDWGKLNGAVVTYLSSRRIISCAICGKIAFSNEGAFSCQVVPDSAVKKALELI